ncbi:MAG: diacylglycerol kinase family protein [Chloroflexota bacterium]
MKIIVIFNPWANRGKAQSKQAELESLCQRHGFYLQITQRAGDAQRFAKEAAEAGADIVAAAGGDGTVHEVVNGLCQVENLTSLLGILPVGSGNDLAFGLGIPTRLSLAAERLLNGQTKKVDLAKIEDENGRFQYADNNLGIGFDAQIVIQTESINWPGGFFLYLFATLKTLFQEFRMIPLDITFDGETVQQSTLFLALGVGARGGGGFMLTPFAKHDDDLVDSCLVAEASRLRALTLLPSAINGRHVNVKEVTMRQSKKIIIRSTDPMPIHIDGEVFAYPEDNVKAVTITSIPKALQVRL